MGYYVMLKNHDLEYRERQPKTKPFIKEQVQRLEEQHTKHTMQLCRVGGEEVGPVVTMDCYCGYDRGPVHTRRVQNMLLGLIEAEEPAATPMRSDRGVKQ